MVHDQQYGHEARTNRCLVDGDESGQTSLWDVEISHEVIESLIIDFLKTP